MNIQRRSSLAAGLVLVLLGAWFLALQFVPGLREWADARLSWPLIVVGVGGVLLLIGLLTWVPGMAVPAAIVAGIGGLLYWQNATGNWESWAYAWTLIPGFVGVGALLSGLLSGDRRQIGDGIRSLVASLILFLIFGSLFGGLNLLGPYWPVLLIAVGLYLIARRMFSRQ